MDAPSRNLLVNTLSHLRRVSSDVSKAEECWDTVEAGVALLLAEVERLTRLAADKEDAYRFMCGEEREASVGKTVAEDLLRCADSDLDIKVEENARLTAEVERLTRERDEAKALAERNEAFARDTIATGNKAVDRWQEEREQRVSAVRERDALKAENERLRRVEEAAKGFVDGVRARRVRPPGVTDEDELLQAGVDGLLAALEAK